MAIKSGTLSNVRSHSCLAKDGLDSLLAFRDVGHHDRAANRLARLIAQEGDVVQGRDFSPCSDSIGTSPAQVPCCSSAGRIS